MKKLQSNFTTPEQSKRLLKLGVPVDSADCYYDSWGQIQWRQLKDLDHDFFQKYNYYTTCWSVGRLMEIYGFGTNQHIGNIWYRNPMECIIADIEISIENGEMNFSKLEE